MNDAIRISKNISQMLERVTVTGSNEAMILIEAKQWLQSFSSPVPMPNASQEIPLGQSVPGATEQVSDTKEADQEK